MSDAPTIRRRQGAVNRTIAVTDELLRCLPWLVGLAGLTVFTSACQEADPTASQQPSKGQSTAAPRICDESSAPTAQGPASYIEGLCVDPNAVQIDVDPLSTPEFEQLCTRRFSAECPEYFNWGLRRFVQLRYVAASGGPENIEVTLLRFTTPEAAHALFTQRGASRVEPGQTDVHSLPEVPDGLILGDTAMVARGTAYVELRYYNRSVAGESQAALAKQRLSLFSPRFVRALPGQPELPRAFTLLPNERLLRFGLRSNYRTAFGIAEVGPSVLGHYRDGERSYNIFAASYSDEAAARDVYRAMRRLPGRHDLEEVPFDAFEVNAAWGREAPSLWLVGMNRGRVAAVGSRRPPPKVAAGAAVDWIERDQKLRLLRQLFARR